MYKRLIPLLVRILGDEMKRIHSTFGTGELEITGSVHTSGPQATKEMPVEIEFFFKKNKKVKQVSVIYERDGRKSFVIYSRMEAD